MLIEHFPARLTVNLDQIASNTAKIKAKLAPTTQIMAIVKANAYGHGLLESAHAALKGGATWLGVAKISEALLLREYLDADTEGCSHHNTRIFSWIYGPDAPYSNILRADLDVSVSTLWEIEKFADAAKKLGNGQKARLHIKLDTGFGRNGFTLGQFSEFQQALDLIKHYEELGLVVLEGVWSHLANADTPGNKETVQKTFDQQKLFDEAIVQIGQVGLNPQFKHLAASAAVLLYPQMHYNLVRPGIILYGLSPNPEEINVAEYKLKPALKLEVQMNNVKQVERGVGISYGHEYYTTQDTQIGIVPLGYADGILRACGSSKTSIGAPVLVNDKLAHIAGRVCMDQFMIDIGPDAIAKAGDWVTLFGAQEGEPSVDEWAKIGGTINYEILTKTTPLAPVSYIKAPTTGFIPRIDLDIVEASLSQANPTQGDGGVDCEIPHQALNDNGQVPNDNGVVQEGTQIQALDNAKETQS
ncbi:alanine racemase [Actinomycetota bacterium]|nr:alanine racemase [Actinomycetota bacterium]